MSRCTPVVFIGLFLVASLTACGDGETDQQLNDLQGNLLQANSMIDSLTYTIDASSQLITELRARADSLEEVDAKLLVSVQKLSKEVKEWRQLATEQKKKNEQLVSEVERMKREKQTDQQAIAKLSAQANSLNVALLGARSNIQRQNDRIRRLETQVTQTREEAEELRKAQVSVRLVVGTEKQLEEWGYLESSRPLSRIGRKTYKLVKKIDEIDSSARLVAIGQTITLNRKPKQLIDRFGRLDDGRDYRQTKEDGQVQITFINELMGGTDVLAMVEE